MTNRRHSYAAAVAGVAGVTPTLSTTTARNGTRLTLTLTVASTVPAGDYPFVVRAILEQSDYHSWPVILRVTP